MPWGPFWTPKFLRPKFLRPGSYLPRYTDEECNLGFLVALVGSLVAWWWLR